MSKQEVFSGLPFPVSCLNKKIYRDEITRLLQIRENTNQKKSMYLDTFPARQSVITKITPKKILENFSDFHYVASKNKMH